MSNTEYNPIFQAIGVIEGECQLSLKSSSITIQDKKYKLFWISQRKKVFDALLKEVERTGAKQKLLVYPRIIHFPDRDKEHIIGFQLVGFAGGKDEALTSELKSGEFKLSGLWRFIPVCRTPCISVLRNFTEQRLEFVKNKEIDQLKKQKFLKGSHIPVMWRDSVVPPFRFNPKAEKEEQGKPFFVSIKCKFNLERGTFNFISLLAPPLQEPPKFLKAKKDKKNIKGKPKEDKPKSKKPASPKTLPPVIIKKKHLEDAKV